MKFTEDVNSIIGNMDPISNEKSDIDELSIIIGKFWGAGEEGEGEIIGESIEVCGYNFFFIVTYKIKCSEAIK